MAQLALSAPPAFRTFHPWLVRKAMIAGVTALGVLLAIGSRNPISLTVVPGIAVFLGLAVDGMNRRRAHAGRTQLHHRWCTAILGSGLLAGALVVFSAT